MLDKIIHKEDFMITRIVVCPIIRNDDDEYLICKMPMNRGTYPGQWGLPGGGMENNEQMLDSLRREICEELGTELKISEIIPWTFRDTIREKLFPDGSKKQIYMIFLMFDCLADNKIVKLNDEFEAYAWVKPQKLMKYDLNEATKITFYQKGFLPQSQLV